MYKIMNIYFKFNISIHEIFILSTKNPGFPGFSMFYLNFEL